MAKKIKFPLEVKDGFKARNIEELKEYFDMEKVIAYFNSGKLATWLEDRYYDDELDKIQALDISDKSFNKALCEIFDVEYSKKLEVDLEGIARKNERISILKQFIEDKKILDNINNVAFNQEELAELLDEKVSVIYLCGDCFSIPIRIENITYIGINNPIVMINSIEIIDFDKRNIKFENVKFNSVYERLLKNTQTKKYEPSDILGYRLLQVELKLSEEIYNEIESELNGLKLNLNKESDEIALEINKLGSYRNSFMEKFK